MAYVHHCLAAPCMLTRATRQRHSEAHSHARPACDVIRREDRTRQTRLRAQEVRAGCGALRVCIGTDVSNTSAARPGARSGVLTTACATAQRSTARTPLKQPTCISRMERRYWRMQSLRTRCLGNKTLTRTRTTKKRNARGERQRLVSSGSS